MKIRHTEKEKSIFEQFTEQIEKHNDDIVEYQKLAPKVKEIISKYHNYFDNVDVYLTSVSLTPKDENKIPQEMCCDFFNAGIIMTIHHSSSGFGGYYLRDTISLKLNKC